MPTFNYKCVSCNSETPKLAKYSEREKSHVCPKCNSEAVYSPFTAAPGVQFKGSGWFNSGGY